MTLADAEAEAAAAYAAPGRFYHDQRHLAAGLAAVEASALSEDERRLLRWAFLWHDAVYDPARGDNEERSADWAQTRLSEAGVPGDDVGEVVRLILLTKGHRVPPGDGLGS